MNRLVIIGLIVMLSGCAEFIPRVPWTTTDKTMFAGALAANGFDFYTTKRALDNGHRIRQEWQWLYLSDDPSISTLAISKAVQIGLAWIVLDRTPSKWRKPLTGLMIGGWTFYGVQNR